MYLHSANGVLSLLDNENHEVKSFALTKLVGLVDTLWPEIAEEITKIESLCEDETFTHYKLAALLVSKVYYHLNAFNESMHFALRAEEQFDTNANNEYSETINLKCIDEYIRIRQKCIDECQMMETFPNLHRLEQVVNKMCETCFSNDKHHNVLGVAIESRRLDLFVRAITTARNRERLLQYAFETVSKISGVKEFQTQMMNAIVSGYEGLATPDYINMCQCLISLGDSVRIAGLLERLLLQEDSVAMCYQLAFDMVEDAKPQFVNNVHNLVANLPSYIRVYGLSGDNNEVNSQISQRFERLQSILSGDKTIDLNLRFMAANNHSDPAIIEHIKTNATNSITQNATVIANGLMNYGTTDDQFKQKNLDWFGKATNWAKFTATSSLGVIHHGNEKESLKLMSEYLPTQGTASSTASTYAAGGALYALGLIHANHGVENMIEYLLKASQEATTEPVRHGSSLGLGLAALGTERADIYEQLRSMMCMDDAVTGEAAAIAMGMVMAGSGSTEYLNDMISYARETVHDKITRGIALGIALIMYERQEEANPIIEVLSAETMSILRMTGMATIAMAYCGTANNDAIRRLLRVAVSDCDNDVRRWAVTALGFVMCKSPEQLPPLVALLSESYNAHVRYGVAMALGIACSGTALKEAIEVIEPLLNDPEAFVKQGALIAMALILMQQNKVTCPKSEELKETMLKLMSDKHENVMTKFGAIIGLGIMNAGGRNVTISLKTQSGNTNMKAVVGLLVFQNYWFWYPLANFISLAMTPTCVTLLNNELDTPQIDIKSKVGPSVFAYPEPLVIAKEKKKEKVVAAVLSVKSKTQKKDVEQIEPVNVMDNMVKTEPEPKYSLLSNPTRVVSQQRKVIELTSNEETPRYATVKSLNHGGILMVNDNQPDAPMDIFKADSVSVVLEQETTMDVDSKSE